jgi:hypothetical protein
VDLYGHLAAPLGPGERCPHCGGVSETRPDSELGRVCNLCGAPRIPLPRGAVPSEPLFAALRRAEAARRSRALYRGTSVVGGLGLAGTLLLVAAVALIAGGGWALGVAVALGGPAALALALGLSGGTKKTRQIGVELEQAWAAAAADAAREGFADTPADLAAALGIDLARAETLHAMLTVESITASREGAAPKVRIVTHPDARPAVETTLPPDPRFAALEAKADAEAAAEVEATSSDASRKERV